MDNTAPHSMQRGKNWQNSDSSAKLCQFTIKQGNNNSQAIVKLYGMRVGRPATAR